ncbi:membrane fusion protein, macrolide-specific efflux system [Paracoccus alcaliphilus]|mgnify:CR=1 FL=1|uniref:Membrane fusion protein, macrolide-specific efflux system n=1 Tax=Paracoccus alcaliphilus TaxID=34002 RepID=A0A1H8GA79_9RHOB|nr:efflux RND transporter periplasmic adaptor subunit [Paracoccus alcaliphilus]WCR17904.1 efflux RND transporter periplasmic adaptor subunit [Paracoccus alcaliphilus]SEN40660.1 membrane fusion protein, macrolide-specific efflux system [Paracoccus alcaliphilus]
MTKRYRLIVILLLLGAVATVAWLRLNDAQGADRPAVLTAPVNRGTIEQTVLAEGIVKPLRMVAVGAQASGRITAVHVSVGQQVRQGDLIAEIDSVTQTNDLRNAEASLANVRAQLASQQAQLRLAERTLERQSQMRRNLSVTQTDYDSAEEAVAVAQAQIEALGAQIAQAEIGIETARANLDYTRITAPIDGTVLAVVSQEGQTVNSVQQAPTIVVLGQLDQMQVLAQISEADIIRVEAGQPVWFTTLGEPQRVYHATLEAVEPAPESVVNDSSLAGSSGSSSTTTSEAIYYNGHFTVPNEDGRLRTYMTAQVHIVLGRAEDVLTLPSVALGQIAADGTQTVRVQTRDGQIETRQVRIGLNDRVNAEVVEGLSEGDRVVTGQAADRAAGGSGGGSMRRPPMGF